MIFNITSEKFCAQS